VLIEVDVDVLALMRGAVWLGGVSFFPRRWACLDCSRVGYHMSLLTNRLEFAFLGVLAFPNASKIGLSASMRASSELIEVVAASWCPADGHMVA
jgi:hypothetical protein